MTAPLHDRLVAALDRSTRCLHSDRVERAWTDQDPTREPWACRVHGEDFDRHERRVKHQRNVLKRHAVVFEVFCEWCIAPNAAYRDWPCPDVRDLAGMLDVEVPS